MGTRFSPGYGKDLEKQLMSETSGHFKRLMVSLASVSHVALLRVQFIIYVGFLASVGNNCGPFCFGSFLIFVALL